MEQELRLPETDDDFRAVAYSLTSVLLAFCRAVTRSHPNPAALAAALETAFDEDREDETPFNELLPPNQLGRQYAETYEQMFLRIARNRAKAGASTGG